MDDNPYKSPESSRGRQPVDFRKLRGWLLNLAAIIVIIAIAISLKG